MNANEEPSKNEFHSPNPENEASEPVDTRNYFDFLWKDKKPFSRKINQIATFLKDKNGTILQVEYKEEEFKLALEPSKASNRLIMFVVISGMFQTGKTTTLKAITRNVAHVVGQGYEEETNGVWIDGPYEIDTLIREYGFEPKVDLGSSSPHVYFLDIEGLCGFKNASNSNEAKILYQSIAIPFIGLSCFNIIMFRQNESQDTLENIFSSLQISDLSQATTDVNKTKILLGVTGVQKSYNNVLFTGHISKETSDTVSKMYAKKLKQNFDFDRYDSIVRFRCLPYIDSTVPSKKEKVSFSSAFDIFAQEIFSLIESSATSFHVRYFDDVIKHFNSIRSAINSDDFKSNVTLSFDNSMQKTIEKQIENGYKIALDGAIEELENSMNEMKTQKNIDLRCFSKFAEQCLKKYLSKYDSSILPGVKIMDKARNKRDQLFNLLKDTVQNMQVKYVTENTSNLMKRIETNAQEELSRIMNDLDTNLQSKEFYCDNAKRQDEFIRQIQNQFKETINNSIPSEVKHVLEESEKITAEEIDRYIKPNFAIIESRIHRLFNDAKRKFSTIKDDFKLVPDPDNSSYMTVQHERIVVDPFGNEIEKCTGSHYLPVDQSMIKKKDIGTRIKEFFNNIFGKRSTE